MELLLHLDLLSGALLLDQEHHELVEGLCLQVRVVQLDLCQVGQLVHHDLEELEGHGLEGLVGLVPEEPVDLVLEELVDLVLVALAHLYREQAEGPFLAALEH